MAVIKRSLFAVKVVLAVSAFLLVPFTLYTGSSGSGMHAQEEEERTAEDYESENQLCPMSDEQQEQAPKAFAAMTPTFTHPRCINCHGAVNPFVPGGKHVGGITKRKMEKREFEDPLTGKNVEMEVPESLVDPKDPEINRTWDSCQDCHSGLPGWRIAPPNMSFVNKDPEQLCLQMKFFLFNPTIFIEHLDHEAEVPVKFLREGFKGGRGLEGNDNGQATLLNETGREFNLEPPPITHAAFVDQGRTWMQWVGSEIAENPTLYPASCGCKTHKYALHVKYTNLVDVTVAGAHNRTEERGETDVPLHFDKDGNFTGSAPLKLSLSGTAEGMVSCKLGGIDEMMFKTTGKLKEQKLDTKTAWSGPGALVSGTCTTPIGTVPINNRGKPINSSGIHTPLVDGFKMRGRIGATKTFPYSMASGQHATVELKIIELR